MVRNSVENRVLTEKKEKRGFFGLFFLNFLLMLNMFTNIDDETTIIYFSLDQCFKMGVLKYFAHSCICDGYLVHHKKKCSLF